MEATFMNIKQHWVSITIISIVLVIFLLIVFARANEGLDQYEKNELETSHHQYLSKGA
ncbi:hypothetical protein SSME_03590 [Staphylococcus saprophyticus subsp. saprophyticus KACC 16562]|nr:hypothetical protein SSME_03590 [Staphylococcus saprophyticus subsp. saprophyticus KACC 16562]